MFPGFSVVFVLNFYGFQNKHVIVGVCSIDFLDSFLVFFYRSVVPVVLRIFSFHFLADFRPGACPKMR